VFTEKLNEKFQKQIMIEKLISTYTRSYCSKNW